MKNKFPDLTGDGKVTQKDVLKGRGVKGMAKGGTAKKGYMGGGKVGYMSGGKVKGYMDGGCVMGKRGVRDTKMG